MWRVEFSIDPIKGKKKNRKKEAKKKGKYKTRNIKFNQNTADRVIMTSCLKK